MFEPFRPTSRAARGTGAVALSTARRIVEAHGGRIELWSKAGEGTTFRVHLPLAAPSERPAPAPQRAGGDGQAGVAHTHKAIAERVAGHAFLCSKRSAVLTGAVIHVNGGLFMFG